MGNTNKTTVHNDLPVDVVVSTYNGEDITVFVVGKGLKPYETFSVRAGQSVEVEAFGWGKGIYIQMTYRGLDTPPYKTEDGKNVRCSALANLSDSVFRDLLRKEEETKPKPAPQLPPGRYDVFLSYRKAADRDVAQLLYFQLQQRQYPNDSSFLPRSVVVFWDEACLAAGENWEEGFLSAITKSELLVLIISEKGLENILNADKAADNVLLEFEYAVKLQEENPKVKIQPIFMQNVLKGPGGQEIITNFNFGNWPLAKFPNSYHVAPKSPKRDTIQKTMEKIFILQGITGPSAQQLTLWGGPTAEIVNRLNK